MTKWEYIVQVRNGQRLYRHPDGDQTKEGVVWELVRTCGREEDSPYVYLSIVVSPGVFDTDEDAKRDALEKLSMLSCPLEQPVAQALRWIHEDL